MPYMNYKEGTGVRARGDLTANVRPTRLGALDDETLVKIAGYLAKEAEAGHTVYLRPELSTKLADALLECVNRVGEA
ncbi:hypothetical protein [Gemmatimonas sp.]|uniref:hypothetical protein n=1 Tax=Gemmatimonas sp. TaxID=1962908 RepID=UPI00334004AF